MVVYPRWRGELNIGNGFAAAASGLSPLARGTHQHAARTAAPRRFIPAGAGNTIVCKFAAAPLAVYPRWRGEHATWRRIMTYKNGLSPLARGTLQPSIRYAHQRRFIPAGAGNTVTACTRCNGSPVYPRWRGEHSSLSGLSNSSAGLSPLARGTRDRRAG